MKALDKLAELQKISCPVRFEFSNKEFIVEIQYFVPLEMKRQKETGDVFFVFAVTTDGWHLLIDANSNSGAVLQREFDDIESIDVTIKEMLTANYVAL